MTYLFSCRGRRESKKPLQTPYVGPFRVLDRFDKFFVVEVGSREERISVDRLKPALVEDNEPVQVAQPP